MRKRIVLTKGEVQNLLLKVLRASGQIPETMENPAEFWTYVSTLLMNDLAEDRSLAWDKSPAVCFEWVEKFEVIKKLEKE